MTSTDRIAVAGIFVLVVIGLLCGCAPQQVRCDLGSFRVKVDTDSANSGRASAVVSVPQQSGKASAAWSGNSSVDYTCARLCQAGQLLRASRHNGSTTIECLEPRTEPLRPGPVVVEPRK